MRQLYWTENWLSCLKQLLISQCDTQGVTLIFLNETGSYWLKVFGVALFQLNYQNQKVQTFFVASYWILSAIPVWQIVPAIFKILSEPKLGQFNWNLAWNCKHYPPLHPLRDFQILQLHNLKLQLSPNFQLSARYCFWQKIQIELSSQFEFSTAPKHRKFCDLIRKFLIFIIWYWISSFKFQCFFVVKFHLFRLYSDWDFQWFTRIPPYFSRFLCILRCFGPLSEIVKVMCFWMISLRYYREVMLPWLWVSDFECWGI